LVPLPMLLFSRVRLSSGPAPAHALADLGLAFAAAGVLSFGSPSAPRPPVSSRHPLFGGCV